MRRCKLFPVILGIHLQTRNYGDSCYNCSYNIVRNMHDAPMVLPVPRCSYQQESQNWPCNESHITMILKSNISLSLNWSQSLYFSIDVHISLIICLVTINRLILVIFCHTGIDKEAGAHGCSLPIKRKDSSSIVNFTVLILFKHIIKTVICLKLPLSLEDIEILTLLIEAIYSLD